eukprot:NODE_3132_length_488_cov_5.257403_g2715_i0.p2 GENE.NODE_3132_length_488_cov_5.257403_g2715_i0~~NODE_3132_length_488_cov_5.257403_g2715_i0.p2  ORF type:complete len:149 (-),score=51.82 NODE_3132_length_488_cov_5.257403_g2715_i0:41-487(-)
MNAAFGLCQLKRVDGFAAKRRSYVERYCELLKGTGLLLPDDSLKPNWLAMPLQYPNRKALLPFLEDKGIQTRVCMAGNVTRHPAYRQYKQAFQNSDVIMANAFLLGAHHGMVMDDVDYVVSCLKEFLAGQAPSPAAAPADKTEEAKKE